MFQAFKDNPPTTDAVDAAILKIEAQQIDLRDQQAAIVVEIAENFDSDTSALEAKHAALNARIHASAIALERLQGERDAAQRRDAVTAYEASLKAVQAAYTTRDKAGKKLVKAVEALLPVLAAYQDTEAALVAANDTASTARYTLEALTDDVQAETVRSASGVDALPADDTKRAVLELVRRVQALPNYMLRS